MPPEGQEFVRVHGLAHAKLGELRDGAIDLGNGMIKLRHRCDRLTDAGQCDIYSVRPAICRAFDCSLRKDCDCHGTGTFGAHSIKE